MASLAGINHIRNISAKTHALSLAHISNILPSGYGLMSIPGSGVFSLAFSSSANASETCV